MAETTATPTTRGPFELIECHPQQASERDLPAATTPGPPPRTPARWGGAERPVPLQEGPSTSLGSISRIPLGQGRCYVVGAQEIAVFRQRDGRLFAVQNRCPHRQGPLSEGVMGGGHVICPLHAHRFNLEDGAGSEPSECVKVYRVDERQGEILLRLMGSKAS